MKKNTKLAYFLRGLGFGIVFVSAVVGISENNKGSRTTDVAREMTREEIIEKAKEIGMVEGVGMKVDAILDATKAPATPAVTQSQGDRQPSKEPVRTEAPSTSKKPLPTKVPEKTKAPKKTTQPEGKVEDGKMTFTIKEGQPASEVVKGLADAGLIKDEKKFHEFLQENDYLTKIIAGEHKITVKGSYKTIAKELCGYQK